MYILNFYRTLFILLILSFILYSCNANQTSNIPRANPTAVPSNIENAFSFEDAINRPFPSNTPIPSPSINLENYIFDLEVNFDAKLGRVSVDDGEVKEIPTKYTLKGGQHKVIIFDLVTGCWIGKNYIIDKNLKLNLLVEKDCNF